MRMSGSCPPCPCCTGALLQAKPLHVSRRLLSLSPCKCCRRLDCCCNHFGTLLLMKSAALQQAHIVASKQTLTWARDWCWCTGRPTMRVACRGRG